MDYSPVLGYIADYWPRIIRHVPREQGTLIGLPRPYLVPSDGSLFQEMYYWDSYFMALGLVGTPHEQLILDMTENLAHLFRRFGVIPNASRYYFLSRSQPPFFMPLVWLAYEAKLRRGDDDCTPWLRRMLALAEREHDTVWMGTRQPHHRLVHAGLSRYFDVNYLDILAGCESGWDHTTRCDERWLAHLPIDLNSILYANERSFARAALLLGQRSPARRWETWAEERERQMQRLLWDPELGFFCDYDYVHEQRNSHLSLAGFYPLWAGLATAAQAERMVRDMLPRFRFPGGLVTTLKERTDRQWAFPNGWAPLQWIVVAGLESYGYVGEARAIMTAWCDNCAAVFERTDTMWEKYNVVSVGALPEAGLYGTMGGFGWSNAVFADFARRLATPSAAAEPLPLPAIQEWTAPAAAETA